MFAGHGFSLAVESRDNEFWVDLISISTGKVVWPNFGAGPSRTMAIMSAEQRWLVEQDGSVRSNGRTYGEMAQDRLRSGRNP